MSAVQQLFYRSVTPVSADVHRDMYVRQSGDFGFARGINSVPITASEFSEAAAEYPIVFAGDGDAVVPAVLLGLREDENLQVDENGNWLGKYVPAFVRRYPFVFSTSADGKSFILNIDDTYSGVNAEGLGERLFDASGEHTVYLKSVLRFLQDYQSHFLRTQAFCNRLRDLKLLQPVHAEFSVGGGKARVLSGFQIVDRAKLKNLSPEELADLCKRDELECIYLHLASQRHFGALVEKLPKASEAA